MASAEIARINGLDILASDLRRPAPPKSADFCRLQFKSESAPRSIQAFTRVQPLASSPAREEKFTKVGSFRDLRGLARSGVEKGNASGQERRCRSMMPRFW